MDTLNYHHLRYFREVAHDGNLTRTAERLNLSQSALSAQIKTLEDRLGHALFDRVDRRLVLTEVGRIALDHADRIFTTGAELIATLQQSGRSDTPLRVGALSTLSRNFQMRFLAPLLKGGEVNVVLKSGNAADLFDSLSSLALDLVLTTEAPRGGYGRELSARRIDEQIVGLHGHPARLRHDTLAETLRNEPLILPAGSSIRSDFDSLAEHLQVRPRVVAEVDDMAMLRLLAREDIGLALAPAIVLRDELRSGMLRSAAFDLQLVESFYAVTPRRSFPHLALSKLFDESAAVPAA